MKFEVALPRFTRGGKFQFQPADGEATLCGVMVDVDENGLCTKAERIQRGGVIGE